MRIRKYSLSGSFGNMLLMVIFAFCSLALTAAAVSCFSRISSGYSGSGGAAAAAQFIVNRIHSFTGSEITVYTDSDGCLERLVLSDSSGYDDVLYMNGPLLCEQLIHSGEPLDMAAGTEIFSVGSITAEQCGMLMKITAGSETPYTMYAQLGAAEMCFVTDGRVGGAGE